MTVMSKLVDVRRPGRKPRCSRIKRTRRKETETERVWWQGVRRDGIRIAELTAGAPTSGDPENTTSVGDDQNQGWSST